MKRLCYAAAAILMAGSLASCGPDDTPDSPKPAEGVEEETYAGGLLGTTFNRSASAYEDPTPAVEQAGMVNEFKYGEFFFEHTITVDSKPFNGLGPVYVRNSCEICHPGYGHGRRMERYNADDWGNGYLLVVYKDDEAAGYPYEPSVTGMPQTRGVAPFPNPIEESGIHLSWRDYQLPEFGNKFPDGETFSLIYPELTIDENAFYAPLANPYSTLGFRLESTIGIYGTGLIDAIPDDSLKAQYAKEAAAGVNLNPAIWAGNDWAESGYYPGTRHPRRFTYALSRGPLQDAPGSNAIWNITNVTRSNKRSHYITEAYSRTASQDPAVQAAFYEYFPEWKNEGATVEEDIYNYLMGKDLPAEMSDQDYVNFMVWHRGLAVPAARNLSDSTVQRGRKLFREMGCAYCHRPSWETGDDNFTDPTGFFVDGDSRLPRYPHQKIWPYSDFVQHRLNMPNDIRTGWCRTTPLWGRGLAQICSGHSDRLHDCRARNTLEAIIWHGCPGSDALPSFRNFYKLSKADRDAVVKFIDAI
ncbi:MAG: hypothetical protein IJ760_02030 [Bacteroidales bacterium]|nr:hypothetical protein [Bacteroidales bacterium]